MDTQTKDNKMVFILSTALAWIVLVFVGTFFNSIGSGELKFPVWWMIVSVAPAIMYGRSAAKPLTPEDEARNREIAEERRRRNAETPETTQIYRCPDCRMVVDQYARVCPYCHARFE